MWFAMVWSLWRGEEAEEEVEVEDEVDAEAEAVRFLALDDIILFFFLR